MNGIRAYFKVSDLIATSGQPTEDQFSKIADSGYSLVINLALPTSTHAIPNERDIVESLGMSYLHIPVSWDEPKLSDLQQFFAAMQSSEGKPVWVHCALNMRVSCFMYLYKLHVLELSEAEAKYPMSEIWQPTGAWEALINAARELYEAQSK